MCRPITKILTNNPYDRLFKWVFEYVYSHCTLIAFDIGEKMNEKTIVDNIKAYLQTIENLFFWKEHGGQYGTAGIPDIIVCYKGKFIAFECKRPGARPTILQKITLNKITRAKGIAKVVTSVEEVQEIIENI